MVYLVHHADAVGPGAIWPRGKLRARQTAEAFWRTCNPTAEFKATRGLQPSDPPEWTKDLLAGETRDVMLVGHMPSLPRIFRLLVAGNEGAGLEFSEHGFV